MIDREGKAFVRHGQETRITAGLDLSNDRRSPGWAICLHCARDRGSGQIPDHSYPRPCGTPTGGGADAARESARSATISPVRTDFSRLSDAACVLCALRSTLLSSQEVAARRAYARSKPG